MFSILPSILLSSSYLCPDDLHNDSIKSLPHNCTLLDPEFTTSINAYLSTNQATQLAACIKAVSKSDNGPYSSAQ